LTFGMIVGIPTMQLLLFGFAINHRYPPSAGSGLMTKPNTALSRELVAELAVVASAGVHALNCIRRKKSMIVLRRGEDQKRSW
jgi:uncharacterized membrane protein YidH (DUF202 family)